jgi:hypothetical protein
MTEDTKQFIIKALSLGAVLLVLYFVFSPYRNCMKGQQSYIEESGSASESIVYCAANTDW